MNNGHFHQTGQIVLNPKALEFYRALYGEQSLEDCGRVGVERFLHGYEAYNSLYCLRLSYICLLKMPLIHKQRSGFFVEKFEEYQAFVGKEIRLCLGHETVLALYYFANLVGKLMRVQPGMPFKDAKRMLWSTAWDLLLLRLPEFLLKHNRLPRINLGYACSADRRMAELGKLFTVLRLLVRSDSNETIASLLAVNSSKLAQKVGLDAVRAVETIQTPSWPDFRRPVLRPLMRIEF